jgi:hypothetical protein
MKDAQHASGHHIPIAPGAHRNICTSVIKVCAMKWLAGMAGA